MAKLTGHGTRTFPLTPYVNAAGQGLFKVKEKSEDVVMEVDNGTHVNAAGRIQLAQETIGRDHGSNIQSRHGTSSGWSIGADGIGSDVWSTLSDAIYRFGDTHPALLSVLGLRRSPSVATLSRLLRMVSVSEVREALLRFVMELSELRGKRVEVAAMDGKTVRGVWENGEQLRTLHVFSREGALALDQMKIESHPQEPRAALMWVKRVSSRFEGLGVLTGDALYAHADLAEAILSEGKDYVVKLKKTGPNSTRT